MSWHDDADQDRLPYGCASPGEDASYSLKITIRKCSQRLCQSRQKTGVGQLSMPEEAKIPSGRFFDASDFGRLASWQAGELSATSAAVDRLFGKSLGPDEPIGSNTLQDR